MTALQPSVPGVGTAEDRAAVTAAAMDYLDGFYEGDSTKLARSVAEDVYKYGYGRRPTGYAGSQPACGPRHYASQYTHETYKSCA